MIDLEKVINGKASNAKGLPHPHYLPRLVNSEKNKISNQCSGERCITAEINQRGVGICIANLYHI
jgi:hypothetical protein